MANSTNKIKEQLKKKIDEVSAKVLKAEKAAEKQVRSVLKKTDKLRKDQLKHVRAIVKDAKKVNSSTLMKKAESLKKKIESEATGGINSLLKTLKVPSQKEVDRLNKKISSLEKKLKDLDRDLFGSS